MARILVACEESQAKWIYDVITNAKTSKKRPMIRSKTFPGIAEDIAKQWGDFLNKELSNKL